MDQINFSHKIIKEYQKELYETYSVFVSEEEAQIHLRSLTNTLFPTVIAEQKTESKEFVQGKATEEPACTKSLSVMLRDDGGGEVGTSITPTSGQ